MGRRQSMTRKMASILICLLTSAVLVACDLSQAGRDAQVTEVAADTFATQTAEAPTLTPLPSLTPTPTLTPTPVPPTATPTAIATLPPFVVTDETVLVTATGLMWHKTDVPLSEVPSAEEGVISSTEIPKYVAYVQTLRTGGYSDWRVPTWDEFLTIAELEGDPGWIPHLDYTVDWYIYLTRDSVGFWIYSANSPPVAGFRPVRGTMKSAETPSPSAETPSLPAETVSLPMIEVGPHGANLRSGPSSSFSVVGHVESGSTFEITGRYGDWWQIDYDGTPAWVSSWVVTAVNAEDVPEVHPPPSPIPPTPVPPTSTPLGGG
jgi:hypothetical protein